MAFGRLDVECLGQGQTFCLRVWVAPPLIPPLSVSAFLIVTSSEAGGNYALFLINITLFMVAVIIAFGFLGEGSMLTILIL